MNAEVNIERQGVLEPVLDAATLPEIAAAKQTLLFAVPEQSPDFLIPAL